MGDSQRDLIMLNAVRFSVARYHAWTHAVSGAANTATMRNMMRDGVIERITNVLLSERYAMAVLEQEWAKWRAVDAEDSGRPGGSDTAGRVVRSVEDAQNFDGVVRTALDAASRILGRGSGSVPATEAADDAEGGEGEAGGSGGST